jgi:hypothetical protein
MLQEEYMKDSMGRLVPKDMVSPIDKLRDQTVRLIMDKAFELRNALAAFKTDVKTDINAFLEVSANQYDKTWAGAKGNFTLSTYDGQYKMIIAMDDNLFFDERLQIARDIIGECINKWSEGSRDEIRVLVNDAFQVDKTGKVNTTRVLGLRRLEIDDPEWQKAMKAITDSVQVTGSKQYIRFYERGENGKYKQISLDVASL